MSETEVDLLRARARLIALLKVVMVSPAMICMASDPLVAASVVDGLRSGAASKPRHGAWCARDMAQLLPTT